MKHVLLRIVHELNLLQTKRSQRGGVTLDELEQRFFGAKETKKL